MLPSPCNGCMLQMMTSSFPLGHESWGIAWWEACIKKDSGSMLRWPCPAAQLHMQRHVTLLTELCCSVLCTGCRFDISGWCELPGLLATWNIGKGEVSTTR